MRLKMTWVDLKKTHTFFLWSVCDRIDLEKNCMQVAAIVVNCLFLQAAVSWLQQKVLGSDPGVVESTELGFFEESCRESSGKHVFNTWKQKKCKIYIFFNSVRTSFCGKSQCEKRLHHLPVWKLQKPADPQRGNTEEPSSTSIMWTCWTVPPVQSSLL